ncbi:MAG TPA: DUF4012 domain-containing protein, partial [Actinomycetota bacterium]|nr:DUF4012 domain-containing protein [Actinomycetota bacterium]
MDHSRRRGRETLGWRRVALAIAPVILVTAGAAELKAAAIRSDLEMARRDMGALHESAAQGRIDEATVLARRTSAATDAAARAARSPLVGVLTSIPLLGRQASTVRAMTASAAEASKAVTRLVEALAAAPALRGIDALELSGMNVSPLVRQVSPALPMLREAQAHITRARALLEAAAETGLVAALKHARREFAGELDAAERHIDMAIGLIDLGRRMSTGRPLRLLLLSQDTWELRPTGGFIGSYGILEVRDGRIELLRYDDATIIRRPYPVYR